MPFNIKLATRLLVFLQFLSISGICQVKIYYDDRCKITMSELATHYRLADVDTVTKSFRGQVVDFHLNDSAFVQLDYNSSGAKEGPIKIIGGGGSSQLQGQYVTNKKTGTWIISSPQSVTVDYTKKKKTSIRSVDSVEACLASKERFDVSEFIRKKDYPEIYRLLIKPVIREPVFTKGETSFMIVEQSPTFPTGIASLGEFIGAFLKYPQEAIDNNINGQVIVEFIITEDGSTTDFKIIKGLGYGCDEEAIRVLKLLPDWSPGRQNGRAVKTKYRLPLTFG